MFNRIRHFLSPPERKASRAARLIALDSGGRALDAARLNGAGARSDP
jgi:hypothetical protein